MADTRTVEELQTRVERLDTDLREARSALNAALIAASPYKVGDVIQSRKKGEAKIVRITTIWGSVLPVAVFKKKNGTWGEREYTLHSWDLPPSAE